MTSFIRYAIYYVPPDGALAQFGADWLGWDIARGKAVPAPVAQYGGIPHGDITREARKYGFHATLKPPFRMAAGRTPAEICARLDDLATRLAPVQLVGLGLSRLGGFLALTPRGETSALDSLAATLVEALDDFRALADAAEVARRRKPGMSAVQEENLLRWGYPYVMGEFRFHMTLTRSLEDPGPVEAALMPRLSALRLAPFMIDDVALVGEREDGMFQLIHRYALTG